MVPEAMNRIILWRSVSMPANSATSRFVPITCVLRPKPERSSTMKRRMNSTAKATSAKGRGPIRPFCPSASNQSGKSVRPRSSTRTRASPRNPIRVASVTTSEGRPTRVMNQPFSAPPSTPMPSEMAMAAGAATPCSLTIQPKAQADRPIMEPTDRSISPLMMMKVITRATMIFSIDSWNRLI